MIEIFKKLFSSTKEVESIPIPSSRIFNRILTGKYFGGENIHIDKNYIAREKQKKIDHIKELELLPIFIRYLYKNSNKTGIQENKKDPITEASAVHVVFQKEVSVQGGQMTHVTEITFIVDRSDFDEFEEMSGTSLNDDFRNLTSYSNDTFDGEEKRKEKREELKVLKNP